MKNLPFFCISIILMFMFAIPGELNATNGTETTRQVYLKKQSGKTDKEHTVTSNERHRMPSRPIEGIIGKEIGVNIEDQTSEIFSFEIWDELGANCLYTTGDESDFVNTLFECEGEYFIRFTNYEYIYSGYIVL